MISSTWWMWDGGVTIPIPPVTATKGYVTISDAGASRSTGSSTSEQFNDHLQAAIQHQRRSGSRRVRVRYDRGRRLGRIQTGVRRGGIGNVCGCQQSAPCNSRHHVIHAGSCRHITREGGGRCARFGRHRSSRSARCCIFSAACSTEQCRTRRWGPQRGTPLCAWTTAARSALMTALAQLPLMELSPPRRAVRGTSGL